MNQANRLELIHDDEAFAQGIKVLISYKKIIKSIKFKLAFLSKKEKRVVCEALGFENLDVLTNMLNDDLNYVNRSIKSYETTAKNRVIVKKHVGEAISEDFARFISYVDRCSLQLSEVVYWVASEGLLDYSEIQYTMEQYANFSIRTNKRMKAYEKGAIDDPVNQLVTEYQYYAMEINYLISTLSPSDKQWITQYYGLGFNSTNITEIVNVTNQILLNNFGLSNSEKALAEDYRMDPYNEHKRLAYNNAYYKLEQYRERIQYDYGNSIVGCKNYLDQLNVAVQSLKATKKAYPSVEFESFAYSEQLKQEISQIETSINREIPNENSQSAVRDLFSDEPVQAPVVEQPVVTDLLDIQPVVSAPQQDVVNDLLSDQPIVPIQTQPVAQDLLSEQQPTTLEDLLNNVAAKEEEKVSSGPVYEEAEIESRNFYNVLDGLIETFKAKEDYASNEYLSNLVANAEQWKQVITINLKEIYDIEMELNNMVENLGPTSNEEYNNKKAVLYEKLNYIKTTYPQEIANVNLQIASQQAPGIKL